MGSSEYELGVVCKKGETDRREGPHQKRGKNQKGRRRRERKIKLKPPAGGGISDISPIKYYRKVTLLGVKYALKFNVHH